ncbi:hypothetical protein [Microvirga rosea]|uniref:hypothetical protein n=1 Tax=Microvirga rosea TaxID=2715425 RepID=UPI001D09D708|nr:hypothetical protein [Microvirga rosea]MCB8823445.1 hypothetical protein [Microvirga rosea]
MLRSAFPKEMETGRLIVRALEDEFYLDHFWERAVQAHVDQVLSDIGGATKVGLLGDVDGTLSTYTHRFPDWASHSVRVPGLAELPSASKLRISYLAEKPEDFILACPKAVEPLLHEHMKSARFRWLREDAKALQEFRESEELALNASPALTVNTVCEQAGAVLLIKKRSWPGRGLYELPGAPAISKESLKTTAIRALQRQTEVADQRGPIPEGILSRYVARSAYFDDADRDGRGRFISQAFLVQFPRGKTRFTINGSNADADPHWVQFSDIDRVQLYGDHRMIIRNFLSI